MKFKFTILTCITCMAVLTTKGQEVDQMITAKFQQSTPYDNSCPDSTMAGCGPIAVAQILSYYKQPAHGYGDVSYTSGAYDINVCMDSLSFDWNNMLDEYIYVDSTQYRNYTDAEGKAVADVVFGCGVAMHATYGDSATGVNNYAMMMYGMQHYLHMSVDSRYLRRMHYSTAEWIEMLNEQLWAGHPVFYRGDWYWTSRGTKSGHMFVIDGLDTDGNYHFNFGHGTGSGRNLYDKYTDINVINYSGTYPGGRPVCYNAGQAMVINCFPTPDYQDYPSNMCFSDASIIINKDTTVTSIEVGLGEAFYLGCSLRNANWEKVSINYGWAIEKEGEFQEIISQSTYSLSAGNTFSSMKHLNVSLPTTLDDGEYKLALYFKQTSDSVWQKVCDCAQSEVDATISGGIATITASGNHMQDPQLYLAEDITEVEPEYYSSEPGRSFRLVIANPTTNNFQDTIRLEITTNGEQYTYDAILPVYSQTQTEFHYLISDSMLDIEGMDITEITPYYYYALEGRFIKFGESVNSVESIMDDDVSSDITVYTLDGIKIASIKAEKVETGYPSLLNSLARGIYIIKEGNKSRKILKR